MTDESNQPWSEQYRIQGEIWVDAEAAAQLLEDSKSAVMAQWQTELGDMPVNRAEQTVKASTRWRNYITDTVEARKAANLAKVRLEAIRMKSMEHHAVAANQRVEMRMMGQNT